MLSGVLDNHPQITKYLRAHLVDWLMHVCHVLPKEDQTLPFVAISMMDRYFRNTRKMNCEGSQVQLTGLTGLFMASKYFEI
jgi:hypothetical protein